MFKTNQKRIIKLTAAAIAVAMVGVGSVACSKPDTIKSYEYETSTYKEQVIKDIDSNVKESAQNSKVEIDLSKVEIDLNKNKVNIEKTNENNSKNEQNNANNELLSNNVPNNTAVNTKYKEYKEGDPRPMDQNEYKEWLRAQNGHPQGTDRFGHPFLKEGAEYTWSASGEPNEAPTDGKNVWKGVQNPNTGVKYQYIDSEWLINDNDERRAEIERVGKLLTHGGVDEKTGEVYRKLTPEELKEISAMYSNSFK